MGTRKPFFLAQTARLCGQARKTIPRAKELLLHRGGLRGDFRRQMTRMMLWVAMYALIYALFIDPGYGILQLFAGLTIPLLKRYNGTRGAGRGMKYLFYLYYPAHLFLCGLVRILLYGNVGVMVGGQ